MAFSIQIVRQHRFESVMTADASLFVWHPSWTGRALTPVASPERQQLSSMRRARTRWCVHVSCSGVLRGLTLLLDLSIGGAFHVYDPCEGGDMTSPPKLPAVRLERPGGAYSLLAFCPWCEELHGHGQGYGNRGAHCFGHRGSPFKSSGYDLVPAGTVAKAEEAMPNAPLAGQGRLRAGIAVSQLPLQQAVIRAMLRRKRLGGPISQRFPGATVNVWAPQWSIAHDAPGDDILGRFESGPDLLGLGRALFGIPEGVVAVRVLEGATGAQFDAQAAREISAAVDAWRERGAPRGEGRT